MCWGEYWKVFRVQPIPLLYPFYLPSTQSQTIKFWKAILFTIARMLYYCVSGNAKPPQPPGGGEKCKLCNFSIFTSRIYHWESGIFYPGCVQKAKKYWGEILEKVEKCVILNQKRLCACRLSKRHICNMLRTGKGATATVTATNINCKNKYL